MGGVLGRGADDGTGGAHSRVPLDSDAAVSNIFQQTKFTPLSEEPLARAALAHPCGAPARAMRLTGWVRRVSRV